MSEPPLIIEEHGAVALLKLNRPQRRNALSIDLMESLCNTLDSLSRSDRFRAAVLCGAGPVFCAGLDLVEAADLAVAERSGDLVVRTIQTVRDSSLVTIAAAHGAAMAGGGGLLSACDLVVAGDNLRIGFPETRRGLVPAIVSTILRHKLRDPDLRELFLLAEPITAAHAQKIGLAHRVVFEEDVIPEALRLAQTVLLGGPEAVRQTKRLLAAAWTSDEAAFAEHARAAHHHARSSPEAAEGLRAFHEKRPPRWTSS